MWIATKEAIKLVLEHEKEKKNRCNAIMLIVPPPKKIGNNLFVIIMPVLPIRLLNWNLKLKISIL